MIDRDALRDELIRDEDIRLKPYRDGVGKLTIGVGRNLDDNGISRDEAIALLRNDTDRAIREAHQIAGFAQLNGVRKRALVNMVFNMGLPRVLGFKRMLAAIERGEYGAAAHEMLDSKWAKQVGPRANRLARMMQTGEELR